MQNNNSKDVLLDLRPVATKRGFLATTGDETRAGALTSSLGCNGGSKRRKKDGVECAIEVGVVRGTRLPRLVCTNCLRRRVAAVSRFVSPSNKCNEAQSGAGSP